MFIILNLYRSLVEKERDPEGGSAPGSSGHFGVVASGVLCNLWYSPQLLDKKCF